VQNLSTGVEKTAVTDSDGRWVVRGVAAAQTRIRASAPGFATYQEDIAYDPGQPSMLDMVLRVASTMESVIVSGGTANGIFGGVLKKEDLAAQLAPSANVLNLQQRVAGALPIRVDVPHEGASYRFVRPLVLNEETKLTFTYRKK